MCARSPLVRQSIKGLGALVRPSPNGKYLAVPDKLALVVYDADSLEPVRHCVNLDEVCAVEWSCDSEFVLCGLYKRGIVQVWSILDEEWTCRIDEGQAGLSVARWAPDGRHVVTTSNFELRVTIWSLVTGTTVQILYPKYSARRGLAFSPDGTLMALARRVDCRDVISLFSTESWRELVAAPADTADLAGLHWSPNSAYLAVWDSPLEYRVAIYTRDGRHCETFTAYEHALGVRAVAWSPGSQFLAVGSYDEKLRILSHLTWQPLAEFRHSESVDASAVIVYREVSRATAGGDGGDAFANASGVHEQQPAARYVVVEGESVSAARIKPDVSVANPKLGVAALEWSHDGAFVASRNEAQPNVVWIWDMSTLSLHTVLLQLGEVRAMAWEPAAGVRRLALATGTGMLYLWSPVGASCVEVPSDQMKVHGLTWAPDGKYVVLAQKSGFCCCYTNAGSPA